MYQAQRTGRHVIVTLLLAAAVSGLHSPDPVLGALVALGVVVAAFLSLFGLIALLVWREARRAERRRLAPARARYNKRARRDR